MGKLKINTGRENEEKRLNLESCQQNKELVGIISTERVGTSKLNVGGVR